jgi:hypothetical protein
MSAHGILIAVQERNAIIKAPDFYYKEKTRLDFFLILIDIYIYLFGTETTKVIFIISYLYGTSFN